MSAANISKYYMKNAEGDQHISTYIITLMCGDWWGVLSVGLQVRKGTDF